MRFVRILIVGGILSLQTSMVFANPMVHRQGLKIVDGNGQPVKLRGVNLPGWYQWEGFLWGKGIFTSYGTILKRLTKLIGPEKTAEFQQNVYNTYITEADLAKISQLGFNSVRILINKRLLMDVDHPDSGYLQEGWNQLDRALGWCEQNHLYAVLDLHAVPGGQSKIATSDADDSADLVWKSPENQERTVALWKAIAERYKDRSIVAAYDLINEPVPPEGKDLVNLYQRIIQAIRQVDPNHMIMLEGGKLAADFSMFDRPLDPNQIYSLHMYTWFGDDRKKKMTTYETLAQKQQVPFWVGEFGENSYDMIDSTVGLYENSSAIVGWCYFPWKRAPTKYPGILTFDLGEHWKKVIDWIASPLAGKPWAEGQRKGPEEFLQAVKLENCHLDQQMVDILLKRAK